MPARSDPPAGRVAPWVEELVDSGEAMAMLSLAGNHAATLPPLKLTLGIVLVLITLGWYTLVAVTFSLGRVQHVYQRATRGLNLVFGALWIGLGIKLATTKA